jgi:adenylate cyclase
MLQTGDSFLRRRLNATAKYELFTDVLKLIGDGTLAIFTAEDRTHACGAALSAASAARERVEGVAQP